MTWEAAVVFLILAATLGLLLWEKYTPDIVSLAALCLLLVLGILTPAEAFAVFGNQAVLTVICMFVLSAALERTGVIDSIGHSLDRYLGRSDFSFLLVILPTVAVISAFVNNTPVVIVLLPILISLAARRNIKPSKLLIPVSFASIFGGSCTLIGTSTNLLVSSSAVDLGLPPLGIFELTKVAAPLALVGVVYLLTIGRRLLPARETISSALQEKEIKQFLTEAEVTEDSPLVGKAFTDTPLVNLPQAQVLEIIRHGEVLSTPLNEIKLQSGDHVRLSSTASSVVEIRKMDGVKIIPEKNLGLELVATQPAVIVECLVGPRSGLIGKSVRQANLRNRFGVLILAVHRHGKNFKGKFGNVRLQAGDALLLEGTHSALRRIRESRDFLVLQDVAGDVPRRSRQSLAIGTLALVVLLASFKVLPIAVLALVGAVFVVLTRCVDVEDAYESIDWQIVMLIYGMLALGLALEETGGVHYIAQQLIRGLGSWGPHVVLSAIFLLASLATTFLSNNAVAVLLTPVVIQAASALEVEARPFLIAVAVGASACFATPIGYQTNTLVYGAGGYRFKDFVKVGVPLNLLFWVLATVLIPWLWPFRAEASAQ